MLTHFALVAPCYSAALQFIVANSDEIEAFEEFKDRSKPLFIVYKKGAKMTVCFLSELTGLSRLLIASGWPGQIYSDLIACDGDRQSKG